MSHQIVLARLDEKKASGPAPSQSPVQSSSGICIKQEYFEDQFLMTIKTESESPPNEHNIMQSIKVEVKEEEHDEDDKNCACPECAVKRELDFGEGGEQMDTERDVNNALPHSTRKCSRSTTIGTSSSSVPPPSPVTNSTSIQANIKVEIEESSTVQLCECVKKEEEDGVSNEQSVQLCECVKKEEEDGGEYVMECDCEECETCRVKREMKEELDESGFETELGGNSGETCQGEEKQEEEDGEGDGERPNKIQRLDRVFGNVPVGSPSPNGISTNVECPDDQMSTSSITSTTIEDHSQPSQPVTVPLPTSIVTPTQPSSSSSSPAVNEPLRAELLNTVPRMDNVFDVPEEFDREQVDEDNSTLNRVHNIEQDFEEDDEQDGDETIEQRQDTSAGDAQQVPAEKFLKRIEPDEFGNRFLCDYQACGKRMKTKRDLIDHIRTHTGEKPFKCSVEGCDRAFVQNSQLRSHLYTHSGTRPFACSWPSCEARFAQKIHLTAHLRTHTGERPFHCDQCNAAYTRHSDLVTHLRTHTGARPFVCTWPDCGQAFAQSGSLKNHSFVHSNERQFSCDARGCTKVYKRMSALRQHQKDKHN